jgi:hypothetical protein
MKLILFIATLFGGTWQEYPMAPGDSIYRLAPETTFAFTTVNEIFDCAIDVDSIIPLARMLRLYTSENDTFLSVEYIPLLLNEENRGYFILLDEYLAFVQLNDSAESRLLRMDRTLDMREFGRPNSPAFFWNKAMVLLNNSSLHEQYPSLHLWFIESVSTD